MNCYVRGVALYIFSADRRAKCTRAGRGGARAAGEPEAATQATGQRKQQRRRSRQVTAQDGSRPDAGRGSHTTHASPAAVAWRSQGDAAGRQRAAWRRAGLPHHLWVRHDLEEDVRVQVRELGRTAEVLAELLVDIDDFHRGLCCVGECAGRRPCYALAHPLPCVATVDVGLAGQKLNTGSGYGKFNLKQVKNNFLKQRVAWTGRQW